MDNQRYFYLAEGECEEKLLNALKLKPSLIHPGKVERFNVIQNEIPTRKLMRYPSGCVVVLVFDTDKEVTEHLKKNLELLRSLPFKVEIMTVVPIITAATTLGELIGMLNLGEKPNDTPTPKKLRETAGEPIAVSQDPLGYGEGSKVYANGYAVYDNGSGRTVIWLPDCTSFT